MNIDNINIEIKRINNTATLVFSDFYITARKSTGGLNVRGVRFQEFWSTIFNTCGCHLFSYCLY